MMSEKSEWNISHERSHFSSCQSARFEPAKTDDFFFFSTCDRDRAESHANLLISLSFFAFAGVMKYRSLNGETFSMGFMHAK